MHPGLHCKLFTLRGGQLDMTPWHPQLIIPGFIALICKCCNQFRNVSHTEGDIKPPVGCVPSRRGVPKDRWGAT